MARVWGDKGCTARRRWTALLGVLAFVLQILLPLSQPRADWVEEGQFPPVCSVFVDLDGDHLPDDTGNGHCLLCQLAATPSAVAPEGWSVPVAWPTAVASFSPAVDRAPAGARFPPASPPRGPPSHG